MNHFKKTYQAPTPIARDTYVIHDHAGEGIAPVIVPVNSMVICGAEPVVVDTGFASNREQYFADLFSLVDPEDIRWVFISHDDIDHTGNLNELMQLAPNATAVVNWFMAERMGDTLQVPLDRMRWVGDGERLDVGDRVLAAVRPPVYDSPTTRGLYDWTTGVYWASDAFATPTLAPSRFVDELDSAFWAEGMAMFHQYVSPWITRLRTGAFQESINRVETLNVTTIAGCHTPTIGAAKVDEAFRIARRSATLNVPAQPGQEVLDQMLLAPPVAA